MLFLSIRLLDSTKDKLTNFKYKSNIKGKGCNGDSSVAALFMTNSKTSQLNSSIIIKTSQPVL